MLNVFIYSADGFPRVGMKVKSLHPNCIRAIRRRAKAHNDSHMKNFPHHVVSRAVIQYERDIYTDKAVKVFAI